MTPLPLLRQDPWVIDHVPGGPDLVIAFASIGHDPTRIPSPEFVRTATAGGRAALFVRDAARSWGTAPGLAQALSRAVTRIHPGGRTLAMGASMGAAVALQSAAFLRLDAVLAIGPQHQPAAPWETRWRRWTGQLAPDLTTPLPQGPWIILMHGLPEDSRQAQAFPPREGVDHLLFPGIAHSALAGHLKAQGGLQGLTEAALTPDRRRLLRIATSAGAMRR